LRPVDGAIEQPVSGRHRRRGKVDALDPSLGADLMGRCERSFGLTHPGFRLQDVERWPFGSTRSLDHGALHATGTEFARPREGLPEELVDILSRLCGFPRRGDVGFRHSALQALWHWLEGKWESIDVGGNPVDRKSTRLNSSHVSISYAVFCLK